ncbi:MAG: long-chain fatty acid--CoA ligase [Candidatus Neomarinimicrobiota bacterium]|nr:MAG: long-chain fatty acid--CoA ligase [Candidatus Neomarinimicrobiota bacterium]
MSYTTIPELFFNTIDQYGNHDAYYEKVDGKWVGLTFREVYDHVNAFAGGLQSLGVAKDDKVAILSTNNPRWSISDYAIVCLGAVTVTVYPTLISHQIKFIVDDSETKLIVVEDEEQAQKVLEFIDNSPKLEKIITMNDSLADNEQVITMSAVKEMGRKKIEEGFSIRESSSCVRPEDLLTLIYTSGTTGNPKGVMLTHNNLVSNIKAGRKAISVSEEDVFLSFLPLSHSFERMVGHYTAFSAGSTVYYAESIDTVAQNMMEVHPTVMTSVPRLYEKMYAKVLDKVSNDPPIRQKIFWWALGVGARAAKFLQRNQQPTGWLAFQFSIANKLVFSKLKERVGGRIRYFVSGGAPLSKDIGEFFASANIPILEGYGLTETSPVITVNRIELYKFGTVGPPIEGVEVKIADDGEILCRGENVMKGYYNNPEATAEVLEPDGWFHTGDIGEFDEDGYLRITDRKKNLIVTSGGKNIAPAPLENALTKSKYIEQCLVIGDKRKFISALIVPSFETLYEWAKANNVSTDDHEQLVQNEKVQALYNGVVEEAMQDFARYEKVKKFVLMAQPWSIETGELTPKLSVKRKVVESKYKEMIDQIYAE